MDQQKLFKKISSVETPNALSVLQNFSDNSYLYEKTKKWIHSQMTSYDYLIELNKLSGRTFNSLSQYPIFPWVIADYTSKEYGTLPGRAF